MAGPNDPVIQHARRRIARAAELLDRGIRELQTARRSLEKHPDFGLTERRQKAGTTSREALTMAWWIQNGIISTLDDTPIPDAPEQLRRELAGGAEADLAAFIRDEEEHLARQRRREVKLRKAA